MPANVTCTSVGKSAKKLAWVRRGAEGRSAFSTAIEPATPQKAGRRCGSKVPVSAW